MVNNIRIKGPLTKIILDEIALDGLEGLTFEGLWTRLSVALQVPIPDLLKLQVWEFIKKSSKHIELFELPAPRPKLKVFNRFDYIDNECGMPLLPDENPGTSYSLNPIAEKNIRGSCVHFNERKLIKMQQVQNLSLNELLDKYGNKLVLVASQECRDSILFPENVPKPKELTIFQYCILEIIARSRFNGEITLGRYSLLTYCRDSSDLFYIRNKLLSLKLITKQAYTEKLVGRIVQGCFLTIPRYFTEYKPKGLLIMENMFNLLKKEKNHIMLYDTLKSQLPAGCESNCKKLANSIFFRKFFEILRVPYRELFPDAAVKQWKRKNGTSEKQILAIKLKDPNMTLENLFETELNGKNNDSTVVENEKIEFLNEKHYFVDMPLIQQMYRVIEKHGSVGISQPQLIKYLAINRFSVRGLINKMVRIGIITQYWQEFGRQKTRMYITIKNSKEEEHVKVCDPVNAMEMIKIDAMKLNEQSSSIKAKLSSNQPESCSDQMNSLDKVVVKELKFDDQKYKDAPSTTLRQTKRKKIIIKTISEKLLIDKQSLRKIISEQEVKDGFKDLICMKSLYRMLHWLDKNGMVKCYEFSLTFNDCTKIYQYVAHPVIGSNDKIIKDELIRLQNQFQISTEMKVRNLELIRLKNERKKLRIETNALVSQTQYYHKRAPKFSISRFFHEFLCYLIFDLGRDKAALEDIPNIRNILAEVHPRYDTENLKTDMLPCYEDSVNWKMFIPPLPRADDKPDNWAYFYDIVVRIPLSIIMKLFQIDKDIDPLLNAYVNHPIRQHYILHKLPEPLKEFIFKLRINRTCFNMVKLLSWIGLVQVSKREKKDPNDIWVYLNANAIVLDTSISEPGYKYVSSNKDYAKTQFNFQENSQVVANYWNYLYKTCLITRLGLRIASEKKSCKELEDQPTIEMDEAPKHDVGYIPGDGRGAAGLHAELYAHLKVNWSWTVKMQKKRLITPVAKNSKIKLSELQKLKSGNLLQASKKRKITLMPNKKIQVKRTVKPKSQAVHKIKAHGTYDEIDCLALTKMNSLRVKWNKYEDDLLKISRAVFIYLNKYLSQLHRVISGHIYRDILHRCLNSVNKTSKACTRRLLYLKKFKPTPDVATWVQEMRQNQNIVAKFGERQLDLLRKQNTHDEDFSNSLKVHFVQLLEYVLRTVKNSNAIEKDHEFLIPNSVREFMSLYRVCPPPLTNLNGIKHFHPTTAEEIDISTINSLLHSTLCCTKDKTLYNVQLFEIYKTYKNEVLSKAFDKAKSDNLVVQLKGRASTSSKLGPIHGPSYALSVRYRLALCLNINYDVLDAICNSFDVVIEQCFKKNQSYAFKIMNSGEFHLVIELLAKNFINLEVDIPDKILTLDPKQQTNIDYSDKVLDHFHNILDCAPKKNYSKILGCGDENMYDDDGNLKQIKPGVKFNIANENYKISYNPYDVIFKMPDEYFHFFCALNELNNEVSLNFTNADSNCISKACVLNNPNMMLEIQRISEEKKSLILELYELAADDHRDRDILEQKITVKPNNIMAIFRRVYKFIKSSKNYPNCRKDLGKISVQSKELDIVAISYNILNCKDVVQKTEYEPALSKEEKMNQEAFVVNLSHLKINFQMESKESKNRYKKIVSVPGSLVRPVAMREEILKKVSGYSIWENSGSWPDLEADQNFKSLSQCEKDLAKDVLGYIGMYSLGVPARQLLKKFRNEETLIKITNILRNSFLIMRVGVEYFVYVHRDHVNPWVVQTYNIKRLDMETMRGSTVIIQEPEKRKHSVCDDEDEGTSKKFITESHDGKRISKPVLKYKEPDTTTVKTYTPKDKEQVIYRPTPWIRVNGSINRRVLDKWLGSIIINCIFNPGQSIHKLCETFNQMHPVNIMCLLEILQDLKCLELKILKYSENKKNSLFSSYNDDLIETKASEFSDFEEAFIIPTPNAMLNISLFTGDKKYKSDFI